MTIVHTYNTGLRKFKNKHDTGGNMNEKCARKLSNKLKVMKDVVLNVETLTD